MINVHTLMFDLTVSCSLFNKFVQSWQAVIGTELALVSTAGELVANSGNVPDLDWPKVIKHSALPIQPTQLSYFDHNLLIVPLTQDYQTFGYLVGFGVEEKVASQLLFWGAQAITTHLVDQMALNDMSDELIGAWNQLELIYRVTQNLALTSDLTATLRSILKEIQKVVDTQNGFILLRRENSLTCVTNVQTIEASLSKARLLDHLLQVNQVVLCNTQTECQQIWSEVPSHVKNMLAIQLPNLGDGTEAGLGLINKAEKDFSSGDVKLLASLAQQVGTIIENYLIHHKLVNEERLMRELEIAAEIQESLLPSELPQMEGITLSVASNPASEVGGDFYDFVTLDEANITLIIGDVAGKGIPAAMLTSVIRTMLRVETMHGQVPNKVVHQVNKLLHEDLNEADSFVTAIVATINTRERVLDYASAGHTPALLWRAETETIEQLRATSPPIGIFGYPENPSQSVQLFPNDVLLLYTDGITEAQSPDGELFGLERLSEVVEARATESPEILQQCIQSEVFRFRKNAQGLDDIMLLVVKMLPQSEEADLHNGSNIIKTVEFSYEADVRYLSEIAEKVTHTCRQLPNLPPNSKSTDFIYLVELAISEIVTNIIKYAYANEKGNIDCRITLLNNGVQFDIYDTGVGFNPNKVPSPRANPPDLTREGGWGLHIVRQIMDVVTYEHTPEKGNHWHLLKLLPPS